MTTLNPLPTAPLEEHELYSRWDSDELHSHYNKASGSVQGRFCGRSPIAGGQVSLTQYTAVSGGTSAGFGHLQSHAPYTCPKGHKASVSKNQAELNHIIEEHLNNGGGVLFGTFTMASAEVETPNSFFSRELGFRATPEWADIRNSKASSAEKKHALKELKQEYDETAPADSWEEWAVNSQLKAVRKGVDRMFAGRAWSDEARKHGIIGRATSIELTLTPNANYQVRWWRVKANYHTHFLLFLDRPFAGGDDDEKQLDELKRSLHTRWSNALKTFGFTSTLPNQQLVVAKTGEEDRRRIASYVPKGSLTFNARKRERNSYDLFAPLRESMERTLEDGTVVPPFSGALMLWKNLEASLLGVHLFRITPSLKQRYALSAFRAERETVRKARLAKRETVAVISSADWARLREEAPEAPDLLKDLASQPDGGEEVRDLLTALEIPFIYQGGD